MEYLLIFLKNKISLYGSRAYIATVLSLAGSRYYIENTTITFEEETISIDEMRQRIMDISMRYPWLVYEHKGRVVAYAYADLWKSRSAYRYTLEEALNNLRMIFLELKSSIFCLKISQIE